MTRFCMTRLVITEAEHLVEIGAAFMDRERCCFGGVRGRFFSESKQLLHIITFNESPVESCIYVAAFSRGTAAYSRGTAAYTAAVFLSVNLSAIPALALGRHSGLES